MSKLYGPSDYQDINVTHADGTKCHHNFRAPKNRQAVPGYGDPNRSVPILDCAKCHAHLLREGFANHPDKVRLTADELEYQDRASHEGTLASKLMAESFGQQLAKLASQQLNAGQ